MCKLMKCRIILASGKYTVQPHTVCTSGQNLTQVNLRYVLLGCLCLHLYVSKLLTGAAKCCQSSEIFQVQPPHINPSNIRARHIRGVLVRQHPSACTSACNYASICSVLPRLTSEAEEGEEVLRLGLASGQVLNGRGEG